MTERVEGIYSGYMTAAEGNGFSMFVFYNGVVSGADPLGVSYDGTYAQKGDVCSARVRVKVPSEAVVIQGASAGPAGMEYELGLDLPADFATRDFFRVDTPLGPVNLRLRKLRGL